MRADTVSSIRPAVVLHDLRLAGLAAALLVHAALIAAILFDMTSSAVAPTEPDLATIPFVLVPSRTVRRSTPALAAKDARDLAVDAETPSPVDTAAPTDAAELNEPRSAPPPASTEGNVMPRLIAEAMRRSAACRNLSDDLSPAEQAACDQRRAERGGPAPNLRDPALARFDAEGAARLAAYESLHSGLRPASDETRACPHRTDPMGRCPVQFNVPLYSSQRGLLPGLRKRGD